MKPTIYNLFNDAANNSSYIVSIPKEVVVA
jgi:hypothetical protein